MLLFGLFQLPTVSRLEHFSAALNVVQMGMLVLLIPATVFLKHGNNIAGILSIAVNYSIIIIAIYGSIQGIPWVNLAATDWVIPGYSNDELKPFNVGSLLYAVPSLCFIFLLLNRGVNELFKNQELIIGEKTILENPKGDLAIFITTLLMIATLFALF